MAFYYINLFCKLIIERSNIEYKFSVNCCCSLQSEPNHLLQQFLKSVIIDDFRIAFRLGPPATYLVFGASNSSNLGSFRLHRTNSCLVTRPSLSTSIRLKMSSALFAGDSSRFAWWFGPIILQMDFTILVISSRSIHPLPSTSYMLQQSLMMTYNTHLVLFFLSFSRLFCQSGSASFFFVCIFVDLKVKVVRQELCEKICRKY